MICSTSRLIDVGYTIYLLSHSFLNKFGDIAEVGYWSIILESNSFKTSFLHRCDMCGIEEEWETALL